MFICFFLDTGLKKLWTLLAAMGQPQMLTVIPQTTSFRVLGDQREHEGGLASPGEEVSVFADVAGVLTKQRGQTGHRGAGLLSLQLLQTSEEGAPALAVIRVTTQ